ncbi:hypothetical protein GCM10010240_11440 [Streptomyces griseoviridis]|nr:hypothetical protein GCM10010240_11440 [Streptomyces griseoviridis]
MRSTEPSGGAAGAAGGAQSAATTAASTARRASPGGRGSAMTRSRAYLTATVDKITRRTPVPYFRFPAPAARKGRENCPTVRKGNRAAGGGELRYGIDAESNKTSSPSRPTATAWYYRARSPDGHTPSHFFHNRTSAMPKAM